jgi:ABC-2 type transport system ATP-binding protein
MIETDQLTRRYGSLTAVDALSLRAEPGQVLGLLGPNGAGKSTAMRMIAGFLAPSSGTARVCGHDVRREPLAAKRALGYLPEGAPSYGEMTVREFLHFIARMRGLRAGAGRRRFDDVVGGLQLEGVLEQSIDTLSKGLRRRVGLAQAILHDPPVLMLDEPTDGLDPNQKYAVRQLIDAMARERTILISTHLLEEVHALCNRVAIIARGRLQADATPMELEQRSRYHGAVSFSAPGSSLSQEMLGRLPQAAGIEVDPLDGRVTVFPKPGEHILEPVERLLREQGLEVSEIQLERGRLDEVFRQITLGAGSAR